MTIHVTGTLFAPMTSAVDQTRVSHEGNFAATTDALTAVTVSRIAAAETHAAELNTLEMNTFGKATASSECFLNGNIRMEHAKAMADTNNIRTLYSPSSANGSVGPNGATAPYVSPYVSGSLHQL